METRGVTYPMLSDAEIVECFKDLGVQQVTVQNLAKPEPEFIYTLYESVVQKLMGVTAEEMSKPILELYNDLGHPTLFDSAIYQFSFLDNLFKVMRAAGAEFKLSDLLTPTHQRTRRFLSAVINFAKYREGKFAKFEETDQEGNRLEEEQAMAEDENQNAMADLESMQAEVAAEEPAMKDLLAQLNAITESTESWRKQLEAAKAQQSTLDAKIGEVAKRSERLAGRVAELDKTKAGLMRRVIPDPEKDIRTLEDLRARQKKEEEMLNGAQKLRSERTARRDQLERSSKAVRKSGAICQEISEMLDHVKAERKTLKDCKNSIATDENIMRELDVIIGRNQQQLDSLKERSAQALVAQDKVKDEKMKQLNEARGRKTLAETEHSSVLQQLKTIDLEIAKLETEEMLLTRGHVERSSAVKQSIAQLVANLRLYHQNVHNTMRDTMQSQQEAYQRQQAAAAALSP